MANIKKNIIIFISLVMVLYVLIYIFRTVWNRKYRKDKGKTDLEKKHF